MWDVQISYFYLDFVARMNSMLFQLVEPSQGKSGTFWTSTIKTSIIKNTAYLPWLGSKDWNIDMLIHTIKPREKWYFWSDDLIKSRESKGMMMREWNVCDFICFLVHFKGVLWNTNYEVNPIEKCGFLKNDPKHGLIKTSFCTWEPHLSIWYFFEQENN